jgi:hypothetical protein
LPKNCFTTSCTFGHAGHAADQNDLVDLAGLRPASFSALLAGLDRALDQVVDQRFELGAGQLHVRCFGPERRPP